MPVLTDGPLLTERAASWCAKKISDNKLPLGASFLFGLLAYVFAFTNKQLNFDEVYNLFQKGATTDSGRWGLGLMDHIFPNYSMPWIYGILTLALLAVSVCLMVHIFHIRSKLFQVLLAGNIVVAPSLIATFSFMFTSSSYAFSILCAVMAVYLLNRSPKYLFVPALGFMIFSLSIYQSYVALCAAMLVLVLIQELLEGKDVGRVFRKGIVFLVFLILALGGYYLLTQLVLRIRGQAFNSYANVNMDFDLARIPAAIVLAYRNFFRFFDECFLRVISTDRSLQIHGYLVYACCAMAALWLLTRKKFEPVRIVLLAALIGVFPLAVNCLYLFIAEGAIHTLVVYSFVVVYLFMICLAETAMQLCPTWKPLELLKRLSLDVMAVCLGIVIVINTYVANEAYLNLQLRYENTYAFYNSLLSQVTQTPGFDENTKLAILGTWDSPDFYETEFDKFEYMHGLHGVCPSCYPQELFMTFYMGVQLPFATDAEKQSVLESEAYAQMPVYPYHGSMQKIGDLFVVKLS